MPRSGPSMTGLARPSSPLLSASGTALHRQIFVALRDEIRRGVVARGQALPKEEALCTRFGVSRITVRRALADLAALGLVERRQGIGTFVRGDVPAPRQRPTLSLVDGLRRTADETEVTVFGVQRGIPPAEVADLLQLRAGEAAVRAQRLRSVAGTPVMLTDAWVPMALGKRVTAAALRKRPLYEILLGQGVVLGRVVQEVSAVAADLATAERLGTEVGGPLLKLVRLLHGQDAKPVQYLEVYFSSERSRFLMDIPAEHVNTLSAGQIVHDSALFVG
jgi:GntR family transcriptional regulator